MLKYWNESKNENKFILTEKQLDDLIAMSIYGTLGDIKWVLLGIGIISGLEFLL